MENLEDEDKKIEDKEKINLNDDEISEFFNSITGTDTNGFGLDGESYDNDSEE